MGFFSSIAKGFSAVVKAVVPIAITIGMAYLTGGASLAIQAAVVTTGLTFAAGILAPKPPTTQSGDLPQTDPGIRLQMPPGTNNKIPIVFGYAYTGGIITDARISADNQTMTYVFVMCERSHEVDTGGTVTQMLWNNQLLTVNNSTGWVRSSVTYGNTAQYTTGYANKIRMLSYVEDSDTPYGHSAGPAYNIVPGWDSTKQMSGLVFAVTQVVYDANVGLTGLGQCSWRCSSGISDEPGSILYEYLRNETWGAGIPESEIDKHSMLDKEWKSASKVYQGQYIYYGSYAYEVLVGGITSGGTSTNPIPDPRIMTAGKFKTTRYYISGTTYHQFFAGFVYTIGALGTIDWNLVAGTTGVTYAVGSVFTAPADYSGFNGNVGYATTPTAYIGGYSSTPKIQLLGTKTAYMPTPSLNEYCEELVDDIYVRPSGWFLNGTTRKYILGGMLSTNDTVWNNIQRIMLATNSWFTFDQKTEKWKVVIDRAATTTELTAAYTFTDKNILSDIKVTRTDLDRMYNRVEVTFNDTNARDQKTTTIVNLPSSMWYPNETENTLNISFDLINNLSTARRQGLYYMLQSRNDLSIEFTADHATFQVTAGEVVKVTNSVYGWTNRLFRVMEIREQEQDDGSLVARVRAIEYNPDLYLDIVSPTPSGYYYINSTLYSYTPDLPGTIYWRDPANNTIALWSPTYDYDDDTDIQIYETDAEPTNIPRVIHINTQDIAPYFDVEFQFQQSIRDSVEFSYSTDGGSNWTVENVVETANRYFLNNVVTERFYGKAPGSYIFRVRVATNGTWSSYSPSSDPFTWDPNTSTYVPRTPLYVSWTASGTVPEGGPYGQTLYVTFNNASGIIPLSNASTNDTQSNNTWRLLEDGIGQTGWLFSDAVLNYIDNRVVWTVANTSTDSDNVGFITPLINYKDNNGENFQYTLPPGYIFKS